MTAFIEIVSDPTREQMEAAIAVMNDHGFNVCAPWEGDLDDRQRERYEALRLAIKAALEFTQIVGSQ